MFYGIPPEKSEAFAQAVTCIADVFRGEIFAADMLISAGSSEYALVLDAHNGLQTGGLYYLGSVQNLSSITQTAQAALGNPGGNYRNSLPVWATAGATLLGTAPKQDFTITYLGGDGKNSPQYDISISDITGVSGMRTSTA